jgi:two-component system C4-dicarboxylate transport response regulator DctD
MDELSPPRVAFVDDDADLRRATAQSLTLAGMEVELFDSAAPALDALRAGFEGVIVTDIRMPGMDGLELFAHVMAHDADLPVVLISGHADISTAVAAVQRGAYDFLAKPYGPDRLIQSVRRALEKRRLVLENRRLRDHDARGQGEQDDSLGPLTGTSQAMRQVFCHRIVEPEAPRLPQLHQRDARHGLGHRPDLGQRISAH